MVYGEDLDRLGEDAVPEAWRRYGVWGLVRLLADIAMRLPAEYLGEIRQDVVYAARVLAKAPGFTAVAVLSLAIGIGMCCVVFSECQAMVAPPPGVRDPGELAAFRSLASYPYFEHYREQHRAAVSATAFLQSVPFAVAFTGDKSARSERFYGHLVSPEYFTTLGVTPAAGRLFAPETEKAGMDPVVVVSDRFWRKHLGGDPHAVGRQLRLNGSMATIVGIGPKEFLGIWPVNPADLFVPVTCGAAVAPELSGNALHARDREFFRVVLRLAHGVTMPMAEAELDAITRNLDRETGVQRDHDSQGRVVRLMPADTLMYMTPEMRLSLDSFNVVMWGLILTLMCANLANLMLARGSRRRREIAVRLSVGASRPRLVRQFLTESVLLSVTGGLGGIVMANWITYGLSALPMPTPTAEFNFQPDVRVMAVTLAIAIAAGISFGLAPALSSVRTDIGLILKEGAQAPLRGYRRFGLRNLFLAGQMALSLMLLLVTWYIAIGFRQTAILDPGFEIPNLNLVSIDPVRDGHSPEQAAALFTALPDELSRVNGVRAVSLTGGVPFATLQADQANTRVSCPAGEGRGGQELHAVYRERIGANYFAAFGVPLAGGREFDRRDVQMSAADAPAVLNQTAARELFGAQDAMGRRIREGETSYTVIGVTRDMKSGFLPPKPVASVFLPLTAEWFRKNPTQRATIVVRGTAGRDTLTAVRHQLASLHPDLTVFNVRTLQADLDRMNKFVVWDSAIYIVLGVFALALACIGLGGVTAYAVARRRKEIGIRMALGARGHQVQGLVLREGTALVVMGSVLGFGGAVALTRAFSAFNSLLAVTMAKSANDPLLLVAAPLVLAGLAMLACYLPARRATRIDPMTALRGE
jgi:predicted permease